MIFSRRVSAAEKFGASFQGDEEVVSWISENLRHRKLICPNCRRQIHPDPLIRAEILHEDWGETSNEDNTVVYYV